MVKDIIRETKSVCPVCLGNIDAALIIKEGQVWMSKNCKKHGPFEILLSRDSYYYKRLDEFYFAVMQGSNRVIEYEIWPTEQCNISCPICSMGDLRKQKSEDAPSCRQIENFVRQNKTAFFTLSGGEPTCRTDLADIIRMLRRHRKTVTINTNGLKLADIDYLKDLVQAGIERINLQFDGFQRDTYMRLRGVDLLDVKIRVLKNLEALQVPVVLNVTAVKHLNDGGLAEIIDYAVQNRFINGVTFFTISNIGGARNWPKDQYIVPDEIVSVLSEQTQGRINSKNLYLFQKFHWAVKSFLSQKSCLHNRVFVLVRHNDGYLPIDRFIDLEKLEPTLDRYCRLFGKNGLMAKAFLFFALPIALLRHTAPSILKEFLLRALSYCFKTRHYLNAGKFLYISMSTACDPFKLDYSVMKNCQNEIVCTDKKTGEFRHQGSICRYGMKLEKPLHD